MSRWSQNAIRCQLRWPGRRHQQLLNKQASCVAERGRGVEREPDGMMEGGKLCIWKTVESGGVTQGEQLSVVKEAWAVRLYV